MAKLLSKQELTYSRIQKILTEIQSVSIMTSRDVSKMLGVAQSTAKDIMDKLSFTGYVMRNAGVGNKGANHYSKLKTTMTRDQYISEYAAMSARELTEEVNSYHFMPINLPSAVITLPDESICTRNKPVEPRHNQAKGITATFHGGESSINYVIANI